MILKLSDVIANIFIELDDNGLPMIIDLSQLYKVASLIGRNENYRVELSGASIFELRLNNEQYFNYINDTKEIVPATAISSHDLKARFRRSISTEIYNLYKSPEVKRILGIKNVGEKVYERRGLKTK